jgi:L,D-peptidoglycan transpeptidase YkuD (ErfK/YbiS/YcfS/YnhG family)
MLTIFLALALHACPQRIVVTAPSARSTNATLSLFECGKRVAGPFRAHAGVHGFAAHRHEGDGTTPLGTFGIGPTLYGVDPDPGVRLPYHRLRCGDWWDGDSASPTYNHFRHVACATRPPFGGASEALWRKSIAYRELAFIEFNADPAVPGRGSAIFLHADTGHATNGCISLPRPQLVAVLRRLRLGAEITIAVP